MIITALILAACGALILAALSFAVVAGLEERLLVPKSDMLRSGAEWRNRDLEAAGFYGEEFANLGANPTADAIRTLAQRIARATAGQTYGDREAGYLKRRKALAQLVAYLLIFLAMVLAVLAGI